MKVCIICKKEKELFCFHKNKSKPDGLESRCKSCRHNYNINNRDKLSIHKKIHYANNKEKINKKNKEWYNNNPSKVKNQKLVYSYGITLNQWQDMLISQEFKCKICQKKLDPKENGKEIHVDHNHKTHKVRAILCKRCNSIIGLCDEDKQVLESAIKYLIEDNTNEI